MNVLRRMWELACHEYAAASTEDHLPPIGPCPTRIGYMLLIIIGYTLIQGERAWQGLKEYVNIHVHDYRRPNGDYHLRYDCRWYGVGLRRNYCTAVSRIVWWVWMNSYYGARHFKWFDHIGWCEKPHPVLKGKFMVLGYTGSLREPWVAWRLRIGRLAFGGHSPQWLIRFKQRQNDRYWEQWAADAPESPYDDLYEDHKERTTA